MVEHAPPASSATASYATARAHYLSDDRRDPVKRNWEEPATRAMIARVLDALGGNDDGGNDGSDGGGLSVLDVGAGTGDALRLLRETVGDRVHSYVGIDSDPDMVETATALHDGQPGVRFVRHDVREPFGGDDRFDLLLSTGVPFSHLRPAELHDALRALFSTIGPGHRCAAMIDVLGRYSLEWTPNWDRETWRYAMSFFAGTDDVPHSEMTFHSRASLWAAVTAAADAAGVRVRTAGWHDRAVAVGRHTATGEFAPGVPPYRTLVNRLYDGDVALGLDALAMSAPRGTAPDQVRAFFDRFAGAWNDVLADAAAVEDELGASAAGRVALARSLCALEHGLQRGIGTAHSLTALLVLER